MLCAVLQEVDGPKVKGVPRLVLSRAGHAQPPVVRHPTFTPRVILGWESVPTIGPVPLMIPRDCHIRHLCDQGLDLVKEHVPLAAEPPAFTQGSTDRYG